MRKILTSSALVAASLAFAQVGVNNDDPQATLHIDAKNNQTSGILIPRVSRTVADNMALPSTSATIKESTLIYVDEVDASTAPTNYATQVSSKGFYYFKDGKWVALSGGSAGTGAIVQPYDSPTVTAQDGADFIIYTPTTGPSTLTLSPTDIDGRKVCIFNNSNDDNLTVVPTPRGQNSSVYPNSGSCFVSYDNVWYGVGFY